MLILYNLDYYKTRLIVTYKSIFSFIKHPLIDKFFLYKVLMTWHEICHSLSALIFATISRQHVLVNQTGRVTICGILIENNALIFLGKEQTSISNHSRHYVKGLDNSTPERVILETSPFPSSTGPAARQFLHPFSTLDNPSPILFPLAPPFHPQPFTHRVSRRARELSSDSLTKCRFPSFP